MVGVVVVVVVLVGPVVLPLPQPTRPAASMDTTRPLSSETGIRRRSEKQPSSAAAAISRPVRGSPGPFRAGRVLLANRLLPVVEQLAAVFTVRVAVTVALAASDTELGLNSRQNGKVLVVALSRDALKVSAPEKPEEVMVMASVPLLPAAMVSVAGELLMTMLPVFEMATMLNEEVVEG